MIVRQTFFAGVQDVGANHELGNKAIIEAMSNIANLHGRQAGQSTEDESLSGLAWMVLEWKVQVLSRPRVCETFTVATWAQERTKLYANRDFELYNADGELCALATSQWVAVDIATGSLVRMTPELMTIYDCEPERRALPGFRFKKIRNPDFPVQRTTRFHILRSMIDCNDHVHNTSYLDLVTEALPEELDNRHFDNVEISYRKEIPPRADVLLEYAFSDGKHYVMIRDESGSTLHAIVVLY